MVGETRLERHIDALRRELVGLQRLAKLALALEALGLHRQALALSRPGDAALRCREQCRVGKLRMLLKACKAAGDLGDACGLTAPLLTREHPAQPALVVLEQQALAVRHGLPGRQPPLLHGVVVEHVRVRGGSARLLGLGLVRLFRLALRLVPRPLESDAALGLLQVEIRG